jgi:hypothetical protein
MPEQPEGHASRPLLDLEGALRRLGEQIDVPPHPDYASQIHQLLKTAPPPRARSGPTRKPRYSRPLAVALVLVVVLAVVLGVPKTRQAVADLFGISGVRVLPLPTSGPGPRTTLDEGLDLGHPATLAEAQARVSFRVALPSTTDLGGPDAVYVRRQPGLQAVNLVFRPRRGLPAASDTHVGLLLSEYAGTATPYFNKYVDQRVPLSKVFVDGRWPGPVLPGRAAGIRT